MFLSLYSTLYFFFNFAVDIFDPVFSAFFFSPWFSASYAGYFWPPAVVIRNNNAFDVCNKNDLHVYLHIEQEGQILSPRCGWVHILMPGVKRHATC